MPGPASLEGRRIVVTRAEDQADVLVRMLEERGAQVMLFPAIATEAVESARVPRDISGYDWIVFTSANAVAYWYAAAGAAGMQECHAGPPRICAVGAGTAAALERLGVTVDLMPGEYVAEALASALMQAEPDLRGKHLLLPRGNLARDLLPNVLREAGAVVDEVVVYRTVCPHVPPERTGALLAFRPNVVVFTSSSTVRNFCAILGDDGLKSLGPEVRYASIGPIATRTARELNVNVTIEAKRHDVPGLVEAIDAG